MLSNGETTFQLENKANKNQINKNPLFYLWIQRTVAFCPKILSNIKWLFFPLHTGDEPQVITTKLVIAPRQSVSSTPGVSLYLDTLIQHD